ncbi:tetratricopeptide repeat protein [Leptolyngbya sp. CCNP1308]|uniref:tetratricopeptide repeat protein n=1 Tax=Leptolyngbya sp. CCNP1308 TaxID=3110255 RepID=UPI002B21AF94|nr:tetratricopeptide repeat protein [Leptolyngbya sp. CCNP1308]MEA5449469.1 tetratricopeptide repeat protein [Leptolyngbya sp. CCNP1308]
MKKYQTRMGLAVGLAVVGMPLTVNAQHSRPSLQPRQTSPFEQANELNQQVIERYQAGRYQDAIPLAEESLVISQLLAANRRLDVAASLNNFAGLSSPNSGSMFPVQASPSSPQLAQVTPTTVTGQLDENSEILEDDGSYFNVHTFEGKAGEFIIIELVSEAFDTYLLLRGPDGQTIAQDDDGNGGTNSRIVVTLPTTGTYQMVANSYTVGATGRYTLSWKPATAADFAQAEALQRVVSLNQQVVELYQAGRYQDAIPLAEEALSIRREQLGDRHPDVATSLNNLAFLYQDQGRYGEAEHLYQESLSILREQLGDRHPDVALSLNNLAELYRDQGRYGDAEPLYREALSIRREQLDEHHPDIATSLNNLAGLYVNQGRYGEAETLLQESLSIRREQLDGHHPDIATSLNNLAELYRVQGRYGEAEPLFQEALSIFREQLGDRHSDVATSLNNLAGLYVNQGRYGEAEPLFQESLSILREQLGDRHPDVALSLNNLASLYQEQGRYGEAEPLFQEVLSILREQLGNRHPDVALSLNNLASLYQEQGRYGEAEPLFQEVLSIRREQLGERHPDVAASLSNLAGLYRAQGLYGEAEPLFQEVLSIRREQLGERHPDVAASLSNLAGLYYAQGRYGEVEPLLQEALSIWREQLGNQHPAVALSLNNLAALYQDQGRYGEAEPLYQEALSIWREQLGDRHPDVALSLNNLAELYRDQGRYGEAEPLYQESLSIRREQLGDRHPDVAFSLNNLALLYYAQGRYGEAEPLYQESLSIFREQLGDRHPDVATNLNNLAGLYQAQGDIAQAVPAFQSGLEIQEWNLELNLATLTDAQRQDYAATLAGSTDRAIALSLQATEAQPLGLTTLLRRKGRLLEAGSSSLQRLRQNLTPADRVVLEDFIAVQQRLATLTFNPPPNLSPEQYRQQLAQLETEATDLEKTLAQRSAVFRAETQPVDMATVQAQIPADGMLVEYVRYQPFDAQAGPASTWGDPRYAAYLLFPNGRMEAMDLGDAAKIDAAVLSLAKALEDPNQSVDEIHSRAQTLDALVMAPLREPLEGVEHLLISPDGALNQIPFEVLRSDNGQYLIETFEISYLTSGRDLLKLDLIPPSLTPPMILAAPSYGEIVAAVPDDNGQRSVDLATLSVGPLEYAFREGRALSALLPDADFLTGRDATETALKQSQSPRLLHIATHGLFLEDAPRRQENGDAEGTVFNDTYEVPIENPLLRAMLAMEGFNARKSGQEDGILTALEAASLNLYGTQLVVLSACETAQGEVVSGEGVYGLRRAFTLAGAESLVMSLWRVEDEGTQDLMVRYYENLLNGMGRSEALRQMQLEMIHSNDYSHPYYWAAFVLTGDWRSLKALN